MVTFTFDRIFELQTACQYKYWEAEEDVMAGMIAYSYSDNHNFYQRYRLLFDKLRFRLHKNITRLPKTMLRSIYQGIGLDLILTLVRVLPIVLSVLGLSQCFFCRSWMSLVLTTLMETSTFKGFK